MKVPTPCEALSSLRPVQLLGGEQTLIAVTADGKVYATGSKMFCKCDFLVKVQDLLIALKDNIIFNNSFPALMLLFV